jgi:hypothetical protein
MNGNNAKFKADPEKFLKNSGILCSSMSRHSQVDGFSDIQGHDVVEFDLVPKGRFVELTILGPAGTYAGTKRRGSPIAGHFLHWNGQTASSGSGSFGSIDLSSCTANYIFTAPFTGCRFVVTRDGGILRAYHEPTEDDVTVNYTGEVVLTLGPNYGADAGVSGNGVIVRRPGGWRAIVSTMVFGAKTATVESGEF